MFTCCQCEFHYTPDVTGDGEERMSYNCLDEEEGE